MTEPKPAWGTRKRPDATRTGITLDIDFGQVVVIVTVNFGSDGKPVELFGKVDDRRPDDQRVDSIEPWLEAVCIDASLALQHGCPIETILAKWRGTVFGPSRLGVGTSVLDGMARAIERELNTPLRPSAGSGEAGGHGQDERNTQFLHVAKASGFLA